MTGRPFNAIYAHDPGGPGPYRVDVTTGDGSWANNALTFPTFSDAAAYAEDLFARWTAVTAWRVVTTDTPERERVGAD